MLPRLVLITSRTQTRQPLAHAVRAALEVLPPTSAAVLLREKDLDGGPLIALAKQLRAVTREHQAPLIVSSRWDIALAADADGVHLGGDAPTVEEVRSRVGQQLKIGVSLHGDEVPCRAADYAFISPIFPTRSKPGVPPLEVVGLRRSVQLAGMTPLFALGGVSDPQRVLECLGAGARGVAVLGAVLTSDDPGAHARALYHAIQTHCAVAG